MTDRRGRLESDPFDHRITADGSIRISRAGRAVTVVRGDAARRLAARLLDAEPAEIQGELARATGQYRHGNERG
ncbi:MAG: hypothetical protein M3P84_03210 [Chloroflexota bacterium]|nr:hypothetical protein [Chloroflexota bacterium]